MENFIFFTLSFLSCKHNHKTVHSDQKHGHPVPGARIMVIKHTTCILIAMSLLLWKAQQNEQSTLKRNMLQYIDTVIPLYDTNIPNKAIPQHSHNKFTNHIHTIKWQYSRPRFHNKTNMTLKISWQINAIPLSSKQERDIAKKGALSSIMNTHRVLSCSRWGTWCTEWGSMEIQRLQV